jgi:hypothetical protein
MLQLDKYAKDAKEWRNSAKMNYRAAGALSTRGVSASRKFLAGGYFCTSWAGGAPRKKRGAAGN